MKIITFNLRHDADRWPERRPLIVAELLRERADLVGLQEVALAIGQAQLIADDVNRHLGAPLYQVYVKEKWGPDPDEGIAILSRLPLLEYEALDLPEGERVAQRVRVEHGGAAVDFVNTHLHHRPHFDESIRLPQARALLDWIERVSAQGETRRWLAAGDFNATPDTATIQAMSERLRSAHFALHGAEPERTFPTPLSENRDWSAVIDFIFFDPPRFQVTDARVIFAQAAANDPMLYASDHYGLCAEVTVL